MTPTHTLIGQRIRERRKQLGMSQHTLGKKAGYSNPVITHIENGKINFIFTTLIDVCNALGMDVRECIR